MEREIHEHLGEREDIYLNSGNNYVSAYNSLLKNQEAMVRNAYRKISQTLL
jgi:hypothetical protein